MRLRIAPGWSCGIPPGKGEEWVFTRTQLFAMLRYYAKRLEDWNLELRTCKVCGQRFLASGPRATLCGEVCRRTQAARNKQAFDRRAKENTYDVLYKNACQTWRNRIGRAKKDVPPAQLEALERAFQAFKGQALARKQAVKEGESPLHDFEAWVAEQLAGDRTGLG